MTTCDAAYTTYVDGHPFYDFTGPLPVNASGSGPCPPVEPEAPRPRPGG